MTNKLKEFIVTELKPLDPDFSKEFSELTPEEAYERGYYSALKAVLDQL